MRGSCLDNKRLTIVFLLACLFLLAFPVVAYVWTSRHLWYPIVERATHSLWFPFVPPFFGVLAAFLLERCVSSVRDCRTKKVLLRRLHLELRQARDRLSKLLGHTVPMTSWKLAIYSGRALLLPHETLDKISSLYFDLENYDYEIKLVRGFSESARASVGSPDHEAKQKLAEVRWDQAVQMQKSLIDAIDLLLKEDFWPKDT